MHFDPTASEGASISTDGVVCEVIKKRVARAFGSEGLREFGQEQFNIHRSPVIEAKLRGSGTLWRIGQAYCTRCCWRFARSLPDRPKDCGAQLRIARFDQCFYSERNRSMGVEVLAKSLIGSTNSGFQNVVAPGLAQSLPI